MKEVIALLYRKGLETTLPNVPAPSIALAIAVYLGGQQPLHPVAQRCILIRPEHKVEVIGHQAISNQSHRHAGVRLAQKMEKSVLIVGVVEYARLAIATIQDVVTISTYRCSCGSRHNEIFVARQKKSKKNLAKKNPECPRAS
ncbi:MAG: hypothetical protein WAL71_03225, partial [Terriglobales bacterium]